MTDDEVTEPGWYDDGTGTMRWWDGNDWTDEVLGGEATEVGPSAHGQPAYGAEPAYGAAPGTRPYASDYGYGYGDPSGPHVPPGGQGFGGQGFGGQGTGGQGTGGGSNKGLLVAGIGGVALIAVIVLVIVLVLVNRDGGGGGDDTAGDSDGDSDGQVDGASGEAGFDADEIDLRSEDEGSVVLTITEAGSYVVIAENPYSDVDITLAVYDSSDDQFCENDSTRDVADENLWGEDEECVADLEPGTYDVVVESFWGGGSEDRGRVTLVLEGP